MKLITHAGLIIFALLSLSWSPTVTAADTASADGAEIRQLVNDWADAWRSGRFDSYVNSYTADFTGQSASHVQWRKERKRRVQGRQDISVTLGPVLVELNHEDASIARAVFLQSYKSKSWCDVVEKTLLLKRTSNGWRINGESAVPRRRC